MEYAKPVIVYHNLNVAEYYEVRAALRCVRWGDGAVTWVVWDMSFGAQPGVRAVLDALHCCGRVAGCVPAPPPFGGHLGAVSALAGPHLRPAAAPLLP